LLVKAGGKKEMKDALGKFLVKSRIRAVLPYVDGRLLDIGCGTNELVRVYGNGVGVDVYQWGTVDLVVGNTSDLPFDDESFDTVTIIAALNHIPNRQEVLREAHRLLRRDGRIIITMIPPCLSKVWHFFRKPWDADQKERGMVHGEVFGFTREEVRSLVKEAGFDVILEKRFMLYINRVTVAKKNA
jgi:SAM-dependent methyltransferase